MSERNRMDRDVQLMMLRIAKCRFAPVRKWYINGAWQMVEQTCTSRKGTLAGLDCSHNGDFKVNYVSDPLLAFHSTGEYNREELDELLEKVGISTENLIPIELLRTDKNGNPCHAPAYKSLPERTTQLEGYKKKLNDKSERIVFERENDIEVEL